MRRRACFTAFVSLSLAVLITGGAQAQSRGSATRAAPAAPPSGHQTEAIDLNEGRSAAELFQAGCAVCHQGVAGLAKNRREGELTNFLRQHYTSSVQHAAALANFVAAGGGRGGPATAATPPRAAPIDRPPASIGSRKPDDDAPETAPLDRRRKPQEASRPEREPPAKRRPAEKLERPPATAARVAPAAEADAPPTVEAATSEMTPPAEEKPALPPPPEIPL